MNLNDFDIYHLGVSGGKDSTAAFLWAVYESGWKDNFRVTFCDTGNEDPFTYKFLDFLRKIYPIEIITPIRYGKKTFSEGMTFYDLAVAKKRFPFRKARFCTSWLKVIPSRDYVLNELLAEYDQVLLLTGETKREGHIGNNRGEMGETSWAEDYACWSHRPIYHWKLEDIWEIHKKYLSLSGVLDIISNDTSMSKENKEELIVRMEKHRIPRNPLYDIGAVRVGCFPCINSRKAEIRAMARFRPERIDYLRNQERMVGEDRGDGISTFFARNTVPLAHRTKEIKTVKGEKMLVCTIDDVVQWAKTKYGGKQFEMDLYFEDEGGSCSIGGYCE